MNPRWKLWLIGGLAVAVVLAAIYFPTLKRRLRKVATPQQQSEEQARRELTQALAMNPGEPRVRVKLFWASDREDGTLSPVSAELPLSSDPVLRAKQVLNTLLAGPVDPESRTLPPDAVLLAFYLLPDGTGIADFSEALATSIPSGIQSEQMAVDSITRTLEANVPEVRRLKILIHGQEVETLAGHLDLSGTFSVSSRSVTVQPKPAPVVAESPAAAASTVEKKSADAPAKLTPGATPGKLSQPERKP